MIKVELSIRDFHGFETDLNLITDLTGSLFMISSWISNGMWSEILTFEIARVWIQESFIDNKERSQVCIGNFGHWASYSVFKLVQFSTDE